MRKVNIYPVSENDSIYLPAIHKNDE